VRLMKQYFITLSCYQGQKNCHFITSFGKKASAMLAGHSIVGVTHRVGCRTSPKYRECSAKIGTVGSYADS